MVLAAEWAVSADSPWKMYQGNAAHTGYVPVTLNPTNFTLLWRKTIHSGMPLNPVTAAEGEVFATEFGGFGNIGLYALNAADGNLLWNVNYSNLFSVNPPSYAYGNVYVETGNGFGIGESSVRAYQAAPVI